jgi:hypothetical protein
MGRGQAGVDFRQRFCIGCRAVFYICSYCDRGHRYCGTSCRESRRRQLHREANRRYQQTAYGKADHCDRQRDYRERQAQITRVTDQSSLSQLASGNISALVSLAATEVNHASDAANRWVVCIICKQSSLWIATVEARRWPS